MLSPFEEFTHHILRDNEIFLDEDNGWSNHNEPYNHNAWGNDDNDENILQHQISKPENNQVIEEDAKDCQVHHQYDRQNDKGFLFLVVGFLEFLRRFTSFYFFCFEADIFLTQLACHLIDILGLLWVMGKVEGLAYP